MSKTGKNNEAWLRILADHPVIQTIQKDGFYEIGSPLINKYRESRLMTKFDTSGQIPQCLKDHKITILPTARGKYRLAKMDLYDKLPKVDWRTAKNAQSFLIPGYLHTLTPESLKSEAVATNAAFACGILAEFLNDQKLMPTATGRMGTGDLRFLVNHHGRGVETLHVRKAQMEIDGCFEGLKSVALIEAKTNFTKDFLIRQLYYPYAYWNNKIQKPIRSIFQVYSNETIYLYEYDFQCSIDYNSIKFVRQQAYRLQDREITFSEIVNAIKNTSLLNELPDDFAQANEFERVVSLCEELLLRKTMTNNDVADFFGLDKRQGQYYSTAARYLGLVLTNKQTRPHKHVLSKFGKGVMAKSFADRQIAFIQAMASRPVYRDAFDHFFTVGNVPDRSQIIGYMTAHGVTNSIKKSTIGRRADTVRAWLGWMESLPD